MSASCPPSTASIPSIRLPRCS